CLDASAPKQLRVRKCDGSAAQHFLTTADRELRPGISSPNGEPLCVELRNGDGRIDNGKPVTARPCLAVNGPMDLKRKDAQEFHFSGTIEGLFKKDWTIATIDILNSPFAQIELHNHVAEIVDFYRFNYYFLPSSAASTTASRSPRVPAWP